jgi:hypothetical protein
VERLAEQVVAHEHGNQVVPLGIDRSLAPAGGRLVHHVIVQQGGRVDQLDGHACQNSSRRQGACGASREKHQGGPEALASAAQQMLGDTQDEGRIHGQNGTQLLLELIQILFDGCNDGI